jgi:nicotinate-nucleotide--dimethylbenzimidazole phosphoribosyltransferase
VEQLLRNIIATIEPVTNSLEQKVQAHLDNLTKPRGSLGRLEEFAARYIAITGEDPPQIPKKAIMVFAGDHGITEEGVSAFPKDVTHQMVYNFIEGGAGINVLARHAGADVHVIDIGVEHDFRDVEGLVARKVDYGTANMAKGAAMPRIQAIAAIMAGIELAEEAAGSGARLLGTGEMGIGNTTPASAMTSVLCNRNPEDVTGRGTGIGDDDYRKKIGLIRQAIELNHPDPEDPIDVLAKVGGYEIAGICGLILGAALHKTPVVTDGFISTAGAITAKALCPHVTDYLFAAHQSVEQGHQIQMEYLGLKPMLNLDLRLGEGTGAALAMTLIDAGIKIYNEMATFEKASVAPGDEQI